MTTLYLVGEVSFEYNDEIYHCDTDGSMPVKLFREKENAEEEAIGLTRKMLEDTNCPGLDQYGYEYEEIVDNDNDFLQMLEKNGCILNLEDYRWDSVPIRNAVRKMSTTDFKRFFDSLHIKFYKVYEVELMNLDTEARRMLGDKSTVGE